MLSILTAIAIYRYYSVISKMYYGYYYSQKVYTVSNWVWKKSLKPKFSQKLLEYDIKKQYYPKNLDLSYDWEIIAPQKMKSHSLNRAHLLPIENGWTKIKS